MRKMLFDKYADNPVLTAAQFPSDIMYVMNPGAIKFNGEYLLLVDAATTSTPIIFWIARSKDGIHFTPDPEPIDWPAHRYHETCVFDIRVTELEGVYYLMYCSMTKERGVALGLVKTSDFVHYERIEQADMGYEFRNGALFPEKINGRYVRFDRPMPKSIEEPAGMCISYSDDLMHWDHTTDLMQPRPGCWDSLKIGAGAVPIKTPAGWLEIYHGVDNSSCNDYIYRLGTVLLDLNDPSRIIARAELPVMWPEHSYELSGRCSNVVFTANALAEEDGTVRMYYGCADTCIGLATARLDELVDFTLHGENTRIRKFFRTENEAVRN